MHTLPFCALHTVLSQLLEIYLCISIMFLFAFWLFRILALCECSSTTSYYLFKLILKCIYNCRSYASQIHFNPLNTDIFYRLILQMGSPRFTVCTYRNETDCLYLLYISYLTSFTWHIIWTRIRKVSFQHPWATFLSYTQNGNCPSEPNEQDIQYPKTSLIFVIESQSLCLYPCFKGQGSQFVHLFCNWGNFFFNWLQWN